MRRIIASCLLVFSAVCAPMVTACGGPSFSTASFFDAAPDGVSGGAGAGGTGQAGVGGDATVFDAPDAIQDGVTPDARDGNPDTDADASDAEQDVLDAGGDATGDADADADIGCADGTVELAYAETMHACDGEKSQCEAHALCADGWHLCPMSEYVARGGATTPASVRRWLASCIRTGCGSPVYPTDDICGVCEDAVGNMPDMVWDCSGSVVDTESNCNVGAVSHDGQLRIGSQASACVYARQLGTIGTIGAVCCR